jgi:ABC-type bacteriocin/lantibiotic exporter with double-glycine peptidase domain
MFSGSVRENISIGNDEVSELDIERAAEAACIEKWWFDDQHHETGSEGGRSLSAGQRQRVLIARAILRKPVILILDEGTSCLDLDTERRVVENLRGLHIPFIIIVSHRHSIQSLADRVYYMSQGALSAVKDSVVPYFNHSACSDPGDLGGYSHLEIGT